MERGRQRKGSGHRNLGKKSQGIEHECGQEKVDAQASANKTNFVNKRKKSHENVKGRRYPLRSSQNGVRVLRSMSSKASKAVCVASIAQPITTDHRRKKKRRTKKAVKDEYSRIRKHVRYLLHRMAYEQNFVDAYASEGWKGQSLEKIRPEKELERAKSEIVKCKLRIRSQFQQLDSLISKGRLDDSLFDSEGEIDSEDINCAKCGSKELRKNNDIILCDGICNRGFHQKCLTPPLLNEDIPPGDNAWLCPGCDCKHECVLFITEFHGSDLSIEDSWEKVFPEAAALAARDKKYDDLGLPSDDSEDDDYAPGRPVDEGMVDGENFEESSAEDSSDESFTSEDPVVATGGLSTKNLEYPSDESVDDDFDPDKPSPKVQTQSDRTSSDQSNFTSDTDDLAEFFGSKEDLEPTVENNVDPFESSIRRPTWERDIKRSTENGQLLSLAEQYIDHENIPVIPVKGSDKQSDCQNLYKETYGNASSDSSDDEDEANRNMMKVKNNTTGLLSKNTRMMDNHGTHRTVNGHSTDLLEDPKLDSPDFSLENKSQCRKRKLQKRLLSSADNYFPERSPSKDTSMKHNCLSDLDPEGSKSSSSGCRYFGELITQKLRESFEETHYPSHEMKENLANELGITPKQVDKWFSNARHSFHVSTMVTSQPARITGKGITTTVDSTPIGPFIESVKTAPTTKTKTATDECAPVSMKCNTSDKMVVSQAYSECDQQNLQNKASSSSVTIGKIVEETKETLIEQIDRQQLLLRELRKRKRCK